MNAITSCGRAGWLLYCLLFGLGSGAQAGEAPGFYRRGATWHESMVASQEGWRDWRQGAHASPVLHGGEAAVKVRVDIRGWQELWLGVDEQGDYRNDVANWGEAKLIDGEGREVFLDEVAPEAAQQGWGAFRRDNRSAVGGPIQIGSEVHRRGLGTHAPSAIQYQLTNEYAWFEAWVGVDASRGKEGKVQFWVARTAAGLDALETDWWRQLAADFPGEKDRREMRWEREDQIWNEPWGSLREGALRYAKATRHAELRAAAEREAEQVEDLEALQAVREMYLRSRAAGEAAEALGKFNFEGVRLAIEDLSGRFPREYAKGSELLARLETLRGRWARERGGMALEVLAQLHQDAEELRHEALLGNPLLNFDRLLLIRRSERNLGLPQNWQGNSSLPRSGFENEIATMSPVRPGGPITTLHKPESTSFVGDLDLHFSGERMLFSAVGSGGRWQVFEIGTDGRGLRQVTPGDQPDVDNYDGCYLPDGRVIFCSTAGMVGVPCVDGSDHVATLYRLEADGRTVRQLGFDQDHNWCPTLLNDGRVLYQRWEYADTPHAHTRLLFRMNPDGTGQEEFYGSNSYWPNAMFYARAIPGHATMVAAIVGGHHGAPRMGELVLFDVAKGRQETAGVVQRIPGCQKKVEPKIADQLVDASWPKFLHPFPLSEHYFLVSAKPGPESLWGIYLVDVFDNMLLLAESPGEALLEPIPVRATPQPPAMPDRIDPTRKDALVYLSDIYQGDGLRGVPRGTVKALRVFAYHWAYQGMGGLLGTIGLDGPWDVRQILGTVKVKEDGSAVFRVPANTPISIQPLDEKGRAVQLMRSWFTAMPGENLSCVGCHERQNRAPQTQAASAFGGPPEEIEPWRGPARGFSFKREVQPVLDRHCVRCHDGEMTSDGHGFDLRGTNYITDFRLVTPGRGERLGGRFTVSYANLHRYVRRPGIESDYHLLMPMEYHASTTELAQVLEQGHHGVELDGESWDRLITWMDLNAPFHGSWGEELQDPGGQRERRRQLRKLYAGMDDADAEVLPAVAAPAPVQEHAPTGGRDTAKAPKRAGDVLPNWPLTPAEAARLQDEAGPAKRMILPLAAGVELEFVLIPAGAFVMGSEDGAPEEKPATTVRIEKSFWLSRTEIRNDQFRSFAPSHDSHVESKTAYQFGVHGYPVDAPEQPVVRVSWEQATAFCDWLGSRTGRRIQLPTEAQWEYACRAGSATAFSFGPAGSDFSKDANLADAKLREFATDPYTVFAPLENPSPYEDYIPRENRFNDGALVSAAVGSYSPNAWGLYDMHGNVWEWTRTEWRAYPYVETDGRNAPGPGRRVVRGGSWRDRPHRARSAQRLSYAAWQGVFNVGFRVVCEEQEFAATEAGEAR